MPRSALQWTLCVTALLAPLLVLNAQAQDATALEAQYKTCAKHYIPADKCTPEIYQQLKDKDNAPLDPNTAAALKAVKEYQTRLKNPDSMQVRTAYIVDNKRADFVLCLEIGGQNGAGGMTVSHAVYDVFRGKGHWRDGTGIAGAISSDVDWWDGICQKGTFHKTLLPGTDVTEKVNQALKDGK